MYRTETEEIGFHGNVPLRLSFDPGAIREHFEGSDENPTDGMSDDQLALAGMIALDDDFLYQAFCETLHDAVERVADTPPA